MFQRIITDRLRTKIGKGKAIMLIGPRQVGKTTLIREIMKGERFAFWDGDDPEVRALLTSPNTEQLRQMIGTHTTVFIDEAQRIQNIGITLKIIVDQFKDVQLWISGSSSFTLSHELNEPLTGRKWQYELLPISWQEYEDKVGYVEAEQQLEARMQFGFYPDVLNHPGEEVEILKNLTESYLYKDVLSLAEIRKPEVLEKLVQGLALQIGSEVNYVELAQLTGLDKKTVERYIDILEKGYVIFRLRSFNKNVRNEIKKGRKIYFYDLGIRNTVIGDFRPMETRSDRGGLWENFLITERLKRNLYTMSLARSYFWRTTQQQEIDYLEELTDVWNAYEIKWNPKQNGLISKTFLRNYDAVGVTIHRQNFRDFIND